MKRWLSSCWLLVELKAQTFFKLKASNSMNRSAGTYSRERRFNLLAVSWEWRELTKEHRNILFGARGLNRNCSIIGVQ